jgi:ABC-type Na+ efflux pump permease subunit
VSSIRWRSIRGIARRDLTVVARSKAVMLPIIIIPLLFFVALPVLAAVGLRLGGEEFRELAPLLDAMPPSIREQLGDGPIEEQLLRYILEFQFASLFLIVPLMVAAVIAADSFAGEKERKTLEALLYTPTTDLELYVAKLLGPWLAAVTVAGVGYVLYAISANLAAAPLLGGPVVLTGLWLVTLVWLSPAVAALGLGVLVQVSARVRGFQEAYQLGGAIVLPIVVLVVAQLAGLLFLDVGLAVLLGAAVWLVAGAILVAGYRSFRRERMLVGS